MHVKQMSHGPVVELSRCSQETPNISSLKYCRASVQVSMASFLVYITITKNPALIKKLIKKIAA